ncbi:hypothetical protein Y1Q_0023522 [Alligator mississippiensis]|uniref:Uncharacterized protein n=1 Tax=Alligator mississippiensis TaxID=8496 RepID=A0A151NPV7_ALLMI|nr:hypothetical protein Y1Q_0023522 [Alligator mississippiensis]
MYSWLQALEMKVAKVRPRNIRAVETSDVNTRSSVSVLTSWLKAADFMVKRQSSTCQHEAVRITHCSTVT